MPANVSVEVATSASPALIAAFAALIPQLSKSSPPPTGPELEAMIASDATDVLVASDSATGAFLGSLVLVVFRIPTGMRAWIEDVVVDGDARGRGVGELLNQFALDLAKSKGAKTVDLTSRPSREAANRLYQRLGFVARETNVYRFTL